MHAASSHIPLPFRRNKTESDFCEACSDYLNSLKNEIDVLYLFSEKMKFQSLMENLAKSSIARWNRLWKQTKSSMTWSAGSLIWGRKSETKINGLVNFRNNSKHSRKQNRNLWGKLTSYKQIRERFWSNSKTTKTWMLSISESLQSHSHSGLEWKPGQLLSSNPMILRTRLNMFNFLARSQNLLSLSRKTL